jgi:hypothetical protein
MNEYTIFFIVPIATIIALFIYFMFFYNKKNKIEIYIKGATGNEEFQIQDLQKNIIINKKKAKKETEKIEFETNESSIVVYYFEGGDLFIEKIIKNGKRLLQNEKNSVIRGDLIFEETNPRRNNLKKGNLLWENQGYQIDIGL